MKTVESLEFHESPIRNLPRPLYEASESELEVRRSIGRITTYVLKFLSDKYIEQGFEWLLPVVFSKSTDPLWPDPGASIERRVHCEIYGEVVNTTTSMIVHKMVACSIAFPKLFTYSPNIRIEKKERAYSGIHAYEFTQLDFEVRDASSKDIRSLVEKAVCELIRCLRKDMREELLKLGRYESLAEFEPPFDVYDRMTLLKSHGDQWENKIKALSKPVWITNIPREFYDFEDFESGFWDNYDLMLPGYGEVLSGSRREWEYSKLVRKMRRDGVREEDYALLLRLAREGKLKPTAGAGIGVERLIQWIVGAKHIGEVQPFPKIPGVVYDL
ncbi:MAG: asparagine synthetase A [Candidatus Bathyarchaeia archaeon]